MTVIAGPISGRQVEKCLMNTPGRSHRSVLMNWGLCGGVGLREQRGEQTASVGWRDATGKY